MATKPRNKRQASMYLATMFLRLERILAPSGHSEALLQLCEGEERDHRKHRPGCIRDAFGLTLADAARLFYVRSVLQFVFDRRAPDIRDYFSLRPSLLAGYALYAAHEKEIRAEFTPAEVRDFTVHGHADYQRLIMGVYAVGADE